MTIFNLWNCLFNEATDQVVFKARPKMVLILLNLDRNPQKEVIFRNNNSYN